MLTAPALSAILALIGTPLAAQTLDRIADTGELRIGYRTDAAPLSSANAEGVPQGYSIEICKAVAEYLDAGLEDVDLEIVYVAVDAQDRFDAVANGTIDLLCGAASITLDRRAVVDFSLPVFVDGTAVMLPAGAPTEFDSLAGKKIGVRAGTTTETILSNSLTAAGMDAEIVAVESHAEGLSAMEEGTVDAYFADQSILYGLFFSSDAADTLAVSDNTLTVEKHGLALARGDSDFRLAVDTAISELYYSGEIAAIFGASFPGAEPGVALRALFLLGPDLL